MFFPVSEKVHFPFEQIPNSIPDHWKSILRSCQHLLICLWHFSVSLHALGSTCLCISDIIKSSMQTCGSAEQTHKNENS